MTARLAFAALLACCAPLAASTLRISANSATRLIPGEVEANYGTSRIFLDETAGETAPLTVFFDPETLGVESCEILTNLNRRDRAVLDADGDGVHDGIKPPDANTIPAGSDAHYFKAYPMSLVSGGYQLTLQASKTGAYRLTARYRLNGDAPGTYRYYNSEQTSPGVFKRDHCVVVSPATVREMVMYEINTLNIEAEGTTESLRSTFVDLWDGPGSTRTPRWNLDYARGLGVNWLWFQPIHPFGIDGRHLSAADINNRNIALGFGNPNATTWRWNAGSPSEDVNYPYAFGSPYAVKNFFEVEPRMSKANTRAAAMQEFQDFVAAADNGGTDTVNVMLDAPFNHTSYDCELGAKGVEYFAPTAAPTDEIRNREARFFSRSGNYAQRAFNAGSIAIAPDRGDFGKFIDTYDVYWGRYAALVDVNPGGNGNKDSEADWFDYSVGNEGSSGDGNGHFDAVTQNVWRYFADYCLHWLSQTGCTPGTPAAEQTWKGIDGLRADFAQGIPPQGWEYVVNATRNRKWNFAFMAESLDGGAVTYRSARHFDILNENILFGMKGLNVGSNNMTSSFRSLFESRRASYGQGVVLLNTTSHDEDNYNDPWQALLRYAACSTIDGVPMIFPGQELGISNQYGYDLLERNLGKFIPHFKTWNSMMPLWTNTDFGLDQLAPVYAAIGRARRASPALRSPNRYFLDQVVGGTHQRIFSVAKYQAENASPATSDVVFGFVNLDRDADRNGIFNVAIDRNGSNLFGIKSGRSYNIRNLAAYTAQDPSRDDVLLWPASRSGSQLLANGIDVFLKKVPTDTAGWSSAPYEAQYLKLLDVTPPPSPVPLANYYELGSSGTFTWVPNGGPDDSIASWQLELFENGNLVSTVSLPAAQTSYVFSGTPGAVYRARITAVSSAGISSLTPGQSDAGAPNPASPTTSVILLVAGSDSDGDGQTNADEQAAGTNPLDAGSVFRVGGVVRSGGLVQVTFSSVPGYSYRLETSTTLDAGWSNVGPVLEANAAVSMLEAPVDGPRRFFRVRVVGGPAQ
jgi:glycosidase